MLQPVFLLMSLKQQYLLPLPQKGASLTLIALALSWPTGLVQGSRPGHLPLSLECCRRYQVTYQSIDHVPLLSALLIYGQRHLCYKIAA